MLRLFADCDDWFQAATGHPSGPGDVQSLFYALPEGVAPSCSSRGRAISFSWAVLVS